MEIVKGKIFFCQDCKKEFVYQMKYPSVAYGTTLCRECIKKRRKQKVEQTNLQLHGSANYTNREKAIKTINEKYGSFEEYAKKRSNTIKNNVIEKYGSWENYQELRSEKISKRLKQYYDNEENKKASLEKRKNTNLKKYGVESTTQLKEVQEKMKESKYKGKNKEEVDREILNKSFNTKIQKYGTLASPKQRESARKLCSSKEFKELRKKSCLRKYGTPTFLNLGKHSFKINGQTFDSSWELAYYIWLKDHDIDFIFKPKAIEYFKKDGSIHYYYPDFFTDHYIEIKGDHLLKNGKLINYITGEIMEEKTQCLLDNNVEILTWSNLKPIINEIELKYGKNYLWTMRCNAYVKSS